MVANVLPQCPSTLKMPAFVAPLIGFLLGVAFSRTSAEELSLDPTTVLGSRCLVVAALFSVLVFAPATAYFLVFHLDWAVSYVLDGQRIPSAVVLALVLVNAVSVPSGFVVAAPMVRRNQAKRLLTMVGAVSFVVLMAVLVASRRIAVCATYTQFHGDFGVQGLAGTPLGYAIVWVGIILALSIALTVRQLRCLSLGSRRSS